LFSYQDYLDYRAANRTLAGLAAANKVAALLGDAPARFGELDAMLLGSDYRMAFGRIVTASYFDVLGARTEIGRLFTAEEDRVPDQDAVVVLSHSFWTRQFQSDPAIIGKTVRLTGRAFTVVGVMEPGFVGTEPQIPDFWAPVMMRDALVQSWYAHTWFADRRADCLSLIGRLRPGVQREEAQAELRIVERRIAEEHPRGTPAQAALHVTPGGTFFNLGDYRPLVVPLFLAIGLVLLVACANVANLLLARANARQREISIRVAVGSSRGRLIRQLLTESLLLSLLGGAAALMLSFAGIRILTVRILSSLPLPAGFADTFLIDPQPDFRIFGLAFLLCVATGLISGVLPAWRVSQISVSGGLHGAGQNASRTRNSLVVLQVAVCVALLISAGLLTRNLQTLESFATGLDTRNLYAVRTAAFSPGSDALARRQFKARLESMPGVLHVAEAAQGPLSGRLPTFKNGTAASVSVNRVSSNYFAAVGLPLLRGRVFTPAEVRDRAPVAVISEAVQRRFWPQQDAIGRRMMVDPASPEVEVVGVVPDVRSVNVWRRDEPIFYLPVTADTAQSNDILVKMAAGDRSAIRAEAKQFGGSMAAAVRRIDDLLDFQMAPFRALAALAGSVGILALVMAAIGIYGVISCIVGQRMREFGIRLALGATPRDLLSLVLRTGMLLVAAGIAGGVAVAAAFSMLLVKALTEIHPWDPVAHGGVALLLALVALVACAVPARRAAGADPLQSLRGE
jgi:predicted permease